MGVEVDGRQSWGPNCAGVQARTSGLDFEWGGEGWEAAALLNSDGQMAEPWYTSNRLHPHCALAISIVKSLG